MPKMPMDPVLRKKLEKFYLKHGPREFESRLKGVGLSTSMVQKLRAGTYPHQPEGLYLRAINEALETK